jgi:hypothetical protein
MKRIYRASWVSGYRPIPKDRDFDSSRDVIFSSSDHATFEDAKSAALVNENGYGYAHVDVYQKTNGFGLWYVADESGSVL